MDPKTFAYFCHYFHFSQKNFSLSSNSTSYNYTSHIKYEKHIQNPVKRLRCSFLQKWLTAKKRYLFVFAKSSILDVWQGSEYAFDFFAKKINLHFRTPILYIHTPIYSSYAVGHVTVC